MPIYRFYNGASPTTAGQVAQPTGTAIRTMLQVLLGATVAGRIKGWGWTGSGVTPDTPGTVELIETDVAATSLTALAAADIVKRDSMALLCGDPTTALVQVGTNKTGFNASGGASEGSTTSARQLDAKKIGPTTQFEIQFPLGDEPVVQVGKYCRIRNTFGTTVDVICWVDIEV